MKEIIHLRTEIDINGDTELICKMYDKNNYYDTIGTSVHAKHGTFEIKIDGQWCSMDKLEKMKRCYSEYLNSKDAHNDI